MSGLLTDKEEGFCQAVVSGKTYSDAYRMFYDADGLSVSVVNTLAWKLTRFEKITVRLEQLREQLKDENHISRSELLAGLADVFRTTSSNKERIDAAAQISKMVGFYAPDKLNLGGSDGGALKVDASGWSIAEFAKFKQSVESAELTDD